MHPEQHKRALILFIQTLALYKSFTYLFTYCCYLYIVMDIDFVCVLLACVRLKFMCSYYGGEKL